MDHNPFEAPANNPFEDPSVVQISSDTPVYTNDYQAPAEFENPYEQNPVNTQPEYSAVNTNKRPAIAKNPYASARGNDTRGGTFPGAEEEEALSGSGGGGKGKGGGGGGANDDLAAREAALLKREAELNEREKEVDQNGGTVSNKNWPSKCYPIAHNHISKDIPLRYRTLIRKFYVLLLVTWLTLFLNWLLLLSCFVGGINALNTSVYDVIWSSVYLFVGPVLSWLGWYKRAYYATGAGKNGKWCFFFILFVMHLGFVVAMAISVSKTGGGGVIYTVSLVNAGSKFASALGITTMVLWLLNCIVSVLLLKRAHFMWTTDGHDKTLKRDLAQGILESGVANEVVTGRV